MEKKESKIKSNVATGMSSTAGAAVGVTVGSVISQSVNASEPQELPEKEEDVVPNQTHHSQPVPPPEPTPGPDRPIPEPEPTPEPEPQVEVMSYETVTNEDGSQMDVAVVAVDGQPVLVADLNMDGMADMIAVDENLNGILEENEIHDISDQQIAMQPLQDATEMSMGDDIAQVETDDYINDANVDDYMA